MSPETPVSGGTQLCSKSNRWIVPSQEVMNLIVLGTITITNLVTLEGWANRPALGIFGSAEAPKSRAVAALCLLLRNLQVTSQL